MIEFLYFLPSIGGSNFAIANQSPVTASTQVIGSVKTNDFSFSPGFRVGGHYCWNERLGGLDLAYTRLATKAEQTIFAPSIWANVGGELFNSSLQGYAGLASATTQLLYERLDVWTQTNFHIARWDLSLQGGLQSLYLSIQEQDKFTQVGAQVENVSQRTQIWAMGLEIGAKMRYLIDHGVQGRKETFACILQTTGGLLPSSTQMSLESSVVPSHPLVATKTQDMWRVLPMWQVRFGLQYQRQITCHTCMVEIGYENMMYIRAYSSVDYPTLFADIVINYSDFVAQGLYVTARVGF